MKKLIKRTYFLFILLLVSFVTVNAQDSTKQPNVIKAVAPVYPAIAVAAKAYGEVVVAVTIDVNGKVVSAKHVKGHPLLRTIAELTAKKWLFSSETKDNKERKVELKFVFRIVDDAKDREISFSPPYTVEISSSNAN